MSLVRRFLLSIILSSIACSVLAVEKSYNRYLQKRWSIEEGLLQVVANSITQDEDGYIWIGAQYGLTRFDGVRFKTYTQADFHGLGSFVQVLFTDSQGVMWIGTNKGLLAFKDNQFQLIASQANSEEAYAKSINVKAIAENTNQQVFVNTTSGTFLIENRSLVKKVGYPNVPTFGLLTTKNEVYVGGVGQYFRMAGGQTELIQLAKKFNQLKLNTFIQHNQKIWAGTTVGLYQITDDEFIPFNQHPALQSKPITAMVEDSDGILWVATNSALFRLKNGKILEHIDAENPKAFKALLSIYEDKEKNIWLGSYVNGIAKLNKAFADNYGIESGLNEPIVWSIVDDQNDGIFIGTNDGLEYFKNGQFSALVDAELLPHPVVYSQLLTPEGLIIGTRAGAALYRNNQVEVPENFKGMSYSHIRGILRLKPEHYLFAADTGLYDISPKGWKNISKDADGNTVVMRTIKKTNDGRIIVGALTGVYQYENGNLNRLFPSENSSSSFDVTAIYEDEDGSMIFGTSSSGLVYFNDNQWYHFSDKQAGLPTPGGFSINKDSNEFIWISSFNALYRFPFRSLKDLANESITRLSVDHILDDTGRALGAEKSPCCTGAGSAKGYLKDDTIYLPSRRGLIIVKAALFAKNNQTPHSKIESYLVDKTWRPFEAKQTIELEKESRDIEIRFTTLSFKDSENILIKYKMIGYDEDWKLLEDATRRSVAYTNLPHGNYQFVVKGTNNSGMWGEPSQAMVFIIPPYFYETWYFYLIITLMVVVLGFLLYRIRLLSVERKNQSLEQEIGKKTGMILAVAEAGQQITAGFDFDQTMDAVYQNIKSFMSVDNFGVGILSADKKFLTYDYSISQGKRYVPYQRMLTEKSLPVWCAINAKPVLIGDVEVEGEKYFSPFTYSAEEEKFRLEDGTIGNQALSMLYVPIIYNDVVLGIMGIQSFEKNQYQDAHVDMLSSIANYTAIALENNHMHERMLQSEKIEKDRVLKQKQLAEAANQAKSQFLATMSHEIRTPMNGVIGMVDLLQSTQLDSVQKHYVDIIARSGKTLLSIINDILDYSKIEAGKMALESVKFSLTDVINDCINLFEVTAKEKDIIFIGAINPNVPTDLIGDPTRITQLLINLLGNAFKFTHSGVISLTVSIAEGDKKTKLSHSQPNQIEIVYTVQDTGIGIPKKAQENLFESFHQSDNSTTRKYGGTGLGLAISKRLAEMMGGRIDLLSDKGTGTKFWFTTKVLQQSIDGANESQHHDLIGKKVIVDESKLLFLSVLRGFFESAGAEVTVLSQQAIQYDEKALLAFFKGYDFVFLNYSYFNIRKPTDLEAVQKVANQLPERLFIYGNHEQSSESKLDLSACQAADLGSPINLNQALQRNTKQTATRQISRRTEDKPDLGHLKVLVAEDNQINQVVIKSMLSKLNIVAVIVDDGAKAVHEVEKSTDHFDLILMDCEMPNMDGVEATRQIRLFENENSLNHAKIFALTAHTMKEHQEAVVNAGMDYHLAKPVTVNQLLDALEQFQLLSKKQ